MRGRTYVVGSTVALIGTDWIRRYVSIPESGTAVA